MARAPNHHDSPRFVSAIAMRAIALVVRSNRNVDCVSRGYFELFCCVSFVVFCNGAFFALLCFLGGLGSSSVSEPSCVGLRKVANLCHFSLWVGE